MNDVGDGRWIGWPCLVIRGLGRAGQMEEAAD